MPLFEIPWGIGSLACIGIGIRLWFIRQKSQKTFNYFAKFFIFGGLGFTIATLVGPIITNPFFMKLGMVASLFIIFTSTAYLIRLCCFLFYPKLEKTAFWGVIFCNLLLLVFQLNDFLLQKGFPFFFDSKFRLTIINYPPRVVFLMMIISFFALFIPGIIFIAKGRESEDRKIKVRSALLGLGMVFFGIGGGTNTIPQVPFPLISAASLTFAFFCILVGAYYSIRK